MATFDMIPRKAFILFYSSGTGDGTIHSQDLPLDLVGANENVSNTVDIETSDQSLVPPHSASLTNLSAASAPTATVTATR